MVKAALFPLLQAGTTLLLSAGCNLTPETEAPMTTPTAGATPENDPATPGSSSSSSGKQVAGPERAAANRDELSEAPSELAKCESGT